MVSGKPLYFFKITVVSLHFHSLSAVCICSEEVAVLYFLANLTHYRLYITGFMMWKMIAHCSLLLTMVVFGYFHSKSPIVEILTKMNTNKLIVDA